MKLFRNCPNNHRKECDDCPLLTKCVLKKLKRKWLRFFKTHKQTFVLIAVTTAFIVAMAIICKTFDAFEARTEALKKEDAVENTAESISWFEPEIVTVNIEIIEPKRVTRKTLKKTNNSSLKISATDRKNMEKIVYAESRGEPYEGQVAVAAVILNRYEFCDKKQSITKLVTSPHQFADISNINQKMLDEYPNCQKAVQEALAGNDPTKREFPEGARYFYEPNLVKGHQKEIRKNIKVLKIGNHCFHNDFNE